MRGTESMGGGGEEEGDRDNNFQVWMKHRIVNRSQRMQKGVERVMHD